MRVLVALASETCSTKGIAEFIGERFMGSGMESDVVEAEEAKELRAHGAFAIGDAPYGSRWIEDAIQLVARDRSIPAWVFGSGPTSAKQIDGRSLQSVSGPEAREQISTWASPRDHRALLGA